MRAGSPSRPPSSEEDPRAPGAARRMARGGRHFARGGLAGGRAIVRTWTWLGLEQRIAAVAAVLLIVSTLGPFSFVEAAIVLVALAVLVLLRTRALGKGFHLPFGDGAVIAAAGLWCGFLIVVRVFERPLGQGLLALGCAFLLFVAGARERAKQPPDDTPLARRRERRRDGPARGGADWPTRPLADPVTRPLPDDPPEFR